MARSMAAGFLMSPFSDMEFFAGLTPGYVAVASDIPSKSAWGGSWQYQAVTWTEKGTAFSLSIDAGMCLDYSIWRFDIKLIPAFHYNLTDIYIYPGYKFKVMDALVTNFHLPESTLVMLVSAFAGREHILNAYAEAVKERYRFFSFGDAMFIH